MYLNRAQWICIMPTMGFENHEKHPVGENPFGLRLRRPSLGAGINNSRWSDSTNTPDPARTRAVLTARPLWVPSLKSVFKNLD